MTLKKPTRRQILSTLLCGAAAGTLSNVMLSRANAEPRDPLEQPLFVFVYFGGGWDTLLSLDPRDNTIYGAGSAAGQPLRTDYQDVVDPEVEAILAANETGLVVPDPASNIVFGPAIGRLADHWEDLCVVRGIDMGTVTHEVGRRHFITGKPPRGSAAAGSGLATWIAARNAAIPAIPNLVIGGPFTSRQVHGTLDFSSDPRGPAAGGFQGPSGGGYSPTDVRVLMLMLAGVDPFDSGDLFLPLETTTEHPDPQTVLNQFADEFGL